MKRETYCPRLWREIFIDEEGYAYSCCHLKPEKLGSIYETPLKEIWNGEKLRRLRGESLNGQLKCFKGCNLLEEHEFEEKREVDTEVPYEKLKRLKILFGEACNIECIMCWQDSKKRLCLDPAALMKQVDLSPVESIEIQGGEPMFMPQVREFFDYAAEQGKKVSFLTNGTIMNEEWAEKIAKHSVFIHFSINAATAETHELVNKGSRWEKVMKHIGMIKAVKERTGGDCRVCGHFTIIPENVHEVPAFIEKFSSFGFEEIDFGYDYKFPFYLKLHPKKKRQIKEEIQSAYEKCPDKDAVRTLRLEILGLL